MPKARVIGALVATLLLDGCAAMSFNPEPRAPYNFLVPAGTRTLRVGCAFGNFLSSQQVWLGPLGSRAQYDAFRASYPDEPGGRPLSKRRMSMR